LQKPLPWKKYNLIYIEENSENIFIFAPYNTHSPSPPLHPKGKNINVLK